MAPTLSESTKEICKATAPVLAELGTKITTTMYRNMFSAHPEVKTYFNMSFQRPSSDGGAGHQSIALANSIHAFAASVDDLGALKSAISRIAEKHLSLNVVAEHYAIVGEHLVGAFKEVLGEAATPAVVDAWTEAYTFLADVFITKEQELRDERARKAGGWTGIREFTITSKHDENVSVTTVQLRPTDGAPIPSWKAGQYIGLREALEHETLQRNYSLSCSPNADYFEMAVKRQTTPNQPVGQISEYIHNALPGTVLHVSVPCGSFILEDAKLNNPDMPIVMIGVGIGVSPIFPLAVEALERFPNALTVIHGSKNEEEHTFADRFTGLKEKYPARFNYHPLFKYPVDSSHQANNLSFPSLKSLIPENGIYYFCGPDSWMQEVSCGLIASGVPQDRIIFQFFSPSLL